MFTDIYNAITVFFYRLFITFITALKDLFFWALESIFQAVLYLLSGISGMFGQMDVSSYMSSIPSQVAWVFVQIGLPNAMVIIATAIGIRLILQLIPFVRLGS